MVFGQLLGNRYQLGEKIGVGGMGTVYRATDTTSGNDVAIKLLKQDAIDMNPDIVERFVREAEALRELNHPNIVKVRDTFDANGQQLIVMEFVTGGSLYELLKTRGRLPIAQVLEIALDLADALTRAHRLKIIHRDLKPANVLLTQEGAPRLTDFGVAHMGTKERVTQTGLSIGTPDYMAPEVLNGIAVDERADIWSFGVMLFEMIAGHRPFRGETLTQTLTSILTEPVPDLENIRRDAPIALVDLIYRMLDKDHDTRIPSIRLVGAELEAIMRGNVMTATGTASRVSKPRNRTVDPATRVFTPTTSASQHNLPAETTPFIGRENELHELQRLLSDTDIRLVTILGPGGMGKSRLSLEVARHELPHYANGVYVIWLSSLSSIDRIVPSIADAVGYAFEDGRPQIDQLLDFFREKQMLLLFDNFEHVIEGASIIDDILRAAPGVKILTTSRERLNLSSETIVNLEGMDFPDWETPEDALRYSAVQLFMQSARRARPGFELQADDLTYVARICRMVYGIPLGIILAAAWVESLALDEIADELNQSLDFLESELRDLPERHRSIRAVFEYSWHLLGEQERDIFIKLAVFRNGFDRDAARKITGASLRTLTNLVNKSLVRRNSVTGRYYLHFMLHEYAEEHFDGLRDGERILQMHAEHYATLFSKLVWEISSPNESKAIANAEEEFENALRGVDWCIANREWYTLYKYLRGMWLYYIAHSMLKENSTKFEYIARHMANAGAENHPVYWAARVYEMSGLMRLSDFENSWLISNEAFEHLRNDNLTIDMVEALNNMAYARMRQGRYDESRHHAAAGVLIAEQNNLPATISFTPKAHLGYGEYLAGNLSEAHRIYREILSHVEGFEGTTSHGYAANNLGEVLSAMGKFDEAIEMFEQAYDIFKNLKQKRGMAFALNNLAGNKMLIGQMEDAMANFEETYAINHEIGDRRGMSDSLSLMGNVCEAVSAQTHAYENYQQALNLRREVEDQAAIADSLLDLVRNRFIQNEFEEALEYSEEEVAIRRSIGEPGKLANALAWRGAMNTILGNRKDGERDIEEAIETAKRTGSLYSVSMVNIVRGEIFLHTQDYERALAHFKQILPEAIELNFDLYLIYVMIGMLHVRVALNPSPENYALAVEGLSLRKKYNVLALEPHIARHIDAMTDEAIKVLSDEDFANAETRGTDHNLSDFVKILLQVPL